MPKKYIHKNRGKTLNYNHESLLAAVREVQNGALSVRKAAEKYRIPRSTIADRVSGRFDVNEHVVPGRKPALPMEVETQLVSTVKRASQLGMGVTRKQLLKRTGVLCKRLKIATPMFNNGVPGNAWWEGLKKRHPSIAIRKPEKLGTNRARALNETITKGYFDGLGQIISELNLSEKPQRLWNADETGVQFEHRPVKVIAEKGVKSVVGKTSDTRSNVTIMACGNAAGNAMPPMIIVKGKTSLSLHGYNTEAAPKNTMWSFQEKGWMTDEIGEAWFRNIFLRNCGPERPQLLVIDGHSSHESLGILELAQRENIHILCLPPHCTHYLQPLDRTVFGPFKSAYDRVCSEYLSENSLNTVNKWSFPGLFKKAFDSALSPANLQNGFKACGIYPYNPNCLPKSALKPSVPTETPLPTPGLSPREASMCVNDVIVQTTKPECVPIESLPENHITEVPVDSECIQECVAQATITNVNTNSEQSPNSELSPNKAENDAAVPEDLNEFIDNPEGLFELIRSGAIEIIPTNDPSDPNSVQQANWNEEIDKMFLPVSQASSSPSPTTTKLPAKKNTKHRLLTSEEVIEEKRMAFQKKCEKEEEKVKRQLKKELKSKALK